MTELPFPSLKNRSLNGLNVLTDDAVCDACGVRVAFTGRDGGVSAGPYASLNTGSHVGDDVSCAVRNRRIVLEALGFADAPLIVPNQVHGTDIVRVESADDVQRATEAASEGADAIVVEPPHVGALLNFADCLPLIIVSPSGHFAVAHAGWRGALAGIAGKTVRTLAHGDEQCACGFNAYIGPHIRVECFETSVDIANQFADAYGAEVLDGARHVNLSRVVAIDLMRAGMREERIADAGICTVCNPDRYFSYRAAGGVCGRHAAIAIRRACTA